MPDKVDNLCSFNKISSYPNFMHFFVILYWPCGGALKGLLQSIFQRASSVDSSNPDFMQFFYIFYIHVGPRVRPYEPWNNIFKHHKGLLQSIIYADFQKNPFIPFFHFFFICMWPRGGGKSIQWHFFERSIER